jgi:secondary thiamine-phosphate synthase enzyme
MRQFADIIPIRTHGRGLVDVTGAVSAWVERHGLRTGLLTLYCRHTSASLIIQENAAPEVRADLEAFFDRIAPEDPARYAHNDEGPDDMPAHIRTALTASSFRFRSCRVGLPWERGKGFICSSIGAPHVVGR